MRALFTQFSGLLGILTFVNQMLGGAAVESALLVSLGAGLAVYAVLAIGDLVIQRIVQLAPATSSLSITNETSAAPEASPEAEASTEAKAA